MTIKKSLVKKETSLKINNEIFFKTIEIVDYIKYDFNYVGIRRFIQKFNFFKILPSINIKSAWVRYCYLWNKYINRVEV
jgi:hypothetical protein